MDGNVSTSPEKGMEYQTEKPLLRDNPRR